MSDQNTHSSRTSHDQAADPDADSNIRVEPDLDTNLAPSPTHSLDTNQNTDVSNQGPVHDTDSGVQPSIEVEPYSGPHSGLEDAGESRPIPAHRDPPMFKQSTSHHLHYKYRTIPKENTPTGEAQGSSSILNDDTSTMEAHRSMSVKSSSENDSLEEDLDVAFLEDTEPVITDDTKTEKGNYNGRPDHLHPLDVRWTCSVCVKLEKDVEEIRAQTLANELQLQSARQKLADHHRGHGFV